MPKPWETEELSEDWVPDPYSGSDQSTSSSSRELTRESIKSRRQGYGTVKISATGSKLTLSSYTNRTLQNGGTLIINDALKTGTVKAPPPWHSGTDLFSPLSLETMFNQPNFLQSCPKSSIKRPAIVGAPLRRVSGRPTVRFRSKPSSQASSLNMPMNFTPPKPIPPLQGSPICKKSSTTYSELPCKNSSVLRLEDERGHQLKRTQSDLGDRSHPAKLNHSVLFQLQYDTTTRNCLSALVSQIDSNQETASNGTGSVRSGRSTSSTINLRTSEKAVKGSIRKMQSAPSLQHLRDTPPLQRQPSHRLLTPHPPTWQWLQAQTETDYDPVDSPASSPHSQNSSFKSSIDESLSDNEVLDHEWLRQISLPAQSAAEASYLSNIDFLDDLSVSREINQSQLRTSHEPSFSSSQATSSTERQSNQTSFFTDTTSPPPSSTGHSIIISQQITIDDKFDSLERPLQPLETSTVNTFPKSTNLTNSPIITQETQPPVPEPLKIDRPLYNHHTNVNPDPKSTPEPPDVTPNNETDTTPHTTIDPLDTLQDQSDEKKDKRYSQSMSALYHGPSRALPSDLWNELFQPSPHTHTHLGPDRAADQLKKCGVLPHRVLSGELILIRPSQVGNVPHQVNNMRFNPAHMRWEPICDEDDPFAGMATLKLSPEELATLAKQMSGPEPPPKTKPSPINRPALADLGPPSTSSMSRLQNIIKTRSSSLASQLPLRSTSSLDRNFSPKSSTSSTRYKPASEQLFIPPAFLKADSSKVTKEKTVEAENPSIRPNHSKENPLQSKPPTTHSTGNPEQRESPVLSHVSSCPSFDVAMHGWFVPAPPPQVFKSDTTASESTPRHFTSKATQTDFKDDISSHHLSGFLEKAHPNDVSHQTFSPPGTPLYHTFPKKTLRPEVVSNNENPSRTTSAPKPSSNALHRLFSLYDHPFRCLGHIALVGVNLKSLKELSMPSLVTLDVRYNRLIKVDVSAPRLKKLIVASNWISDFRDISCRCPSLEKLDLSYNRLTTIPDLNATRVQWVSMAYNRITSITGKFPTLTYINLSGNPVATWEGQFPALHTLYLDRLPTPCKFVTQLFHLPSIVRLGLRYTQISGDKFPVNRTLKYLYTQGCDGILPLLNSGARQHQLNHLTYLELSDLQLTTFPWHLLLAASNLVALDVSRNKFNHLSSPGALASPSHPKDSHRLGSHLKWLNLSSNVLNDMANLDQFLAHLPHLQALDLRSNPLRMGLDHPDSNVTTLYKLSFKARLPRLVKLDGHRIK